MSPEVDTSNEQFHWGTPDLDLIRKYPATILFTSDIVVLLSIETVS